MRTDGDGSVSCYDDEEVMRDEKACHRADHLFGHRVRRTGDRHLVGLPRHQVQRTARQGIVRLIKVGKIFTKSNEQLINVENIDLHQVQRTGH